MIGRPGTRLIRSGTVLAMVGLFAQAAVSSLGGMSALAPSQWPNVIEICTGYGIQRIAIPPDRTDADRRLPVPLTDTAACHAFCASHGPTLAASVVTLGAAFGLPAGAVRAAAGGLAPASRGRDSFLARAPPIA